MYERAHAYESSSVDMEDDLFGHFLFLLKQFRPGLQQATLILIAATLPFDQLEGAIDSNSNRILVGLFPENVLPVLLKIIDMHDREVDLFFLVVSRKEVVLKLAGEV
jgi:hypothetical protein